MPALSPHQSINLICYIHKALHQLSSPCLSPILFGLLFHQFLNLSLTVPFQPEVTEPEIVRDRQPFLSHWYMVWFYTVLRVDCILAIYSQAIQILMHSSVVVLYSPSLKANFPLTLNTVLTATCQVLSASLHRFVWKPLSIFSPAYLNHSEN